MTVSIDFHWERAETGYVLVPPGVRDPRGQEHLFGPVREYSIGPTITKIAERNAPQVFISYGAAAAEQDYDIGKFLLTRSSNK
jgi:hypothetical protein